MANDILNVEHKLRGPYVDQTVITWDALTTEARAAGMVEEFENVVGFDTESREDLEHQRDYEERRANDLDDRVEELEEELEKAQVERDNFENERDEAEEKLALIMENAGWKVEREQELELRTAESYALNALCVKLKRWAGRNKQKADVLRFIEECKQECDKAAQEIASKYERMAA